MNEELIPFFWSHYEGRFPPLQLDGNPTTDASAVGNSAERACNTHTHTRTLSPHPVRPYAHPEDLLLPAADHPEQPANTRGLAFLSTLLCLPHCPGQTQVHVRSVCAAS